MYRIIAFSSFALSLFPADVVQAQALQHVTFKSKIVDEATNWSHTLDLPRFDPSLGTLKTIDLTVDETLVGQVRIESTDATPSVVQSNFDGFLGIVAPDGTVMQMPIPVATYQDTFTAFDGVLDYGGTSGITHPEVTLTTSVSHPLPPTTDFAVFTGPPGAPGDMSLTVTALGVSTATGAGNVITQFELRAAASIVIDYGFVGNVPPSFTNCTSVVMGSVGVPLTYQICAVDSDPGDVVTLTATGLPAGASFSPTLPTSGNPACTTLMWTPSSAQTGSTTVTFTATDANQHTATCQVNLVVAECHLVLGLGFGSSQPVLFGQLFDSQIANIRRAYPVTMDDMPAIPFVNLPPTLFVEVLMHNPSVFPSNPDQWSQVLRIDKLPSSNTLSSTLLGTWNGLHISVEDVFDGNGQHFVRFPFSIDGM